MENSPDPNDPNLEKQRHDGLPLRISSPTHQRIIIAHHLILHGYGHWFPNDPRGSGSDDLYDEKFVPLGPIHYGRKRIQPPRSELKQFWRQAEPLLNFAPIWLDDANRQAIGEAFAQLVTARGYTVWA